MRGFPRMLTESARSIVWGIPASRESMNNGGSPEGKPGRTLGMWIGIGLALAAGVDVALGNVALGVGIGL